MSARESQDPTEAGAAPTLTRWQKVRLVVKVVEMRLRFIALMAATGLVFGYWDTLWNLYAKWNRPDRAGSHAAAGFEFYCPMHPNVVQETPGSCPICGMPLSKRKAGESAPLPPGVLARVELAPFRIRQAGIRTVPVAYAPLKESLTTVGYVEADERRLAYIASKVPGRSRVERLEVNFTGIPVRKGQTLGELYSPELYTATQELLINQRHANRAAESSSAYVRQSREDAAELVRLSAEKLKRWGITQPQVDAILRGGQAGYDVPILSPISGFVLEKNVVEGQYVAEGDPMFVVADLDRVWVRAKVYEDQIPLLKVGQEVEATVEAFPGEVFRGAVAFIQPRLDTASRTIDVRYDLDNPGHKIRPGMFATVTLKAPVAELPAFAAKIRKHDHEQAKQASLSVEQQEVCPVTTLKLGAMGDPVEAEVEGRKVWTCCAACPPKLKASPEKFLARLEPVPEDQVLSVPEAAVIDTGTRQVVYVESDPGVFEAREVTLGPRTGDRYPVLDGLLPGENVAAAGAFLIDAETRLNPAAGAAYFGGSGSTDGQTHQH